MEFRCVGTFDDNGNGIGIHDMATVQSGTQVSVDLASAKTASAFVEGIGVNTHLSWLDTSYGDAARVTASMAYLGIDNVRDAAPSAWNLDIYKKYAAAGLDFDFFVPVVDGKTALYESVGTAEQVARATPGSVIGIEGPNEVNIWSAPWKGQTGIAAGNQLQKDLFAAVNGNAVLKDVPVYALTVAGVDQGNLKGLGDLSGAVDYGNVHVYFQNDQIPSTLWNKTMQMAAGTTAGHGIVVTETGFPSRPDMAQGVSEAVQAKETLNVLMNAAEQGVSKTYLYELMDQFKDRTNDPENNYGLFNDDGSPKMVATAIHNMNQILGPEGTAASAAGTLKYKLDGLPSGAHQMVVTESDGTVALVVWNEQQIWDRAGMREKAAQSYSGTLTVDGKADFAVFDPLTGTGATTKANDAGSVSFTLSDHPVIIEITDRAGAGASPSTPTPVVTTPAPSAPIASKPPAATPAQPAPVSDAPATDHAAPGDVVSNVGTDGSDRLAGTGSGEAIASLGGNDHILAHGGNDRIDDGAGDDTAFGGAGDDVHVASAGNDLLNGGDGTDVFDASAQKASVTVDLSWMTGYATGAGIGTDKVMWIENAVLGSGDDKAYGNDGANDVRGGAGDDLIDGRGGDDVLDGGAGRDVVTGGSGDDRILLSSGNDRLDGGDGIDVADASGARRGVTIDLKAGQAFGLDVGRDRLVSFEDILGGSGADRLTGDDRANRIEGGAGDDQLRGNGGDDVFVLARGGGRDTVLDFDHGHDSLAIDAALLAGRDALSLARQAGADTVIDFGSEQLVLKDFKATDLHASDWHSL